ncbi:bactofilin family protein [Hydrogenophaga sp. BPS33]|uniref:bactofilin family protein n=1 Tax=Hydrogenophaga sp. BPS33 TaxID=2651974 RepID=UPI00131FC966|nr:polymer-forming cytoskeletal protein [Hydrogenophaga sp. BPS33]QHE85862.1 polymer-forming cytoskeletal protein [Hydrogenophaga sp. BPS33]
MALHFGKRDDQPKTLNSGMATPRYGQSTGSAQPASPTPTASAPEVETARPVTSSAPTSSTPEGGSKLTVGPNIKLKGVEITDCDTLVVEGLVEATMDSRVIQIAQQGEFKGSAEIDIAEIHGVFDGNLTVRQKLVIYATGKVTGKIHYGKVVIEEGGQLSGDIQCSESSTAKYPASGSQRNMALAA